MTPGTSTETSRDTSPWQQPVKETAGYDSRHLPVWQTVLHLSILAASISPNMPRKNASSGNEDSIPLLDADAAGVQLRDPSDISPDSEEGQHSSYASIGWDTRRESEFQEWSESQMGFNNFTSWLDSRVAFVQVSFLSVVFLTLAVVGYSFIFEDWDVVDSLYTALVIFTTVGTY